MQFSCGQGQLIECHTSLRSAMAKLARLPAPSGNLGESAKWSNQRLMRGSASLPAQALLTTAADALAGAVVSGRTCEQPAQALWVLWQVPQCLHSIREQQICCAAQLCAPYLPWHLCGLGVHVQREKGLEFWPCLP